MTRPKETLDVTHDAPAGKAMLPGIVVVVEAGSPAFSCGALHWADGTYDDFEAGPDVLFTRDSRLRPTRIRGRRPSIATEVG